MKPENLSVIVCTKDRPKQLRLVLLGLASQDIRPGEVVVSDSGELPAVHVIDKLRCSTGLALRYVRRPLRGFQASATRNAGAAAAFGRWLLFLDGDCVPLPGVIGRHLRKGRDVRRVLVGAFIRLDPARSSKVTPARIAARMLDHLVRPEELRTLHWKARTPAMSAGLTDHVWSLQEWLILPAVQRE